MNNIMREREREREWKCSTVTAKQLWFRVILPFALCVLVLMQFISFDLPLTLSPSQQHDAPKSTNISHEDPRVTIRNPSWPQQNHFIRDSIRSGHRIDYNQTPTLGNGTQYIWNGTTCETPPKNMATIVTAYFDIASKHPTHQYEEWANNLLRATDPMIIFVDPTNDYKNWWPAVERGRQHAPTLLVALPFRNLTMSTVFSDTFWKQYILPRDRQSRFRKGVDVYKIWNEKIILMREAAVENPFETEFFYWIDFGYFRKPKRAPKYTPIVRNNITEKGVNASHQLVYQTIFGWPTFEVAGGAWGGTVDAIKVHYQHYWKTFWYLTLYSTKECVGYEQRVQVWMCRSFPKLCVINRNRDWFAMGQEWLRSRTFNMTAHPISIPMDNTTTLPPVPNHVVPFPKNSTIGLLEEIG